MKLALYLPNFRDKVTVKELEELTALAEELDFDSVWTLDRIVATPTFRRRFKAITDDAMLTRLPRGYQEGHPAARWLRYKSFTAYRALTEREIESPRLPLTLERDFAALVPLVRWLNGAIGYRAADRRY